MKAPRPDDGRECLQTNSGAVVVLIVEDSVTQAMKLQQMLENQGYEVFRASDGTEALAKLRERRPNLVISDIVIDPAQISPFQRWSDIANASISTTRLP